MGEQYRKQAINTRDHAASAGLYVAFYGVHVVLIEWEYIRRIYR